VALQVEIVSPERKLWSGEASMVIARTIGGGDIAFLPGHTPFLGALEIETVTIRTTDGPDEMAAVHGGFIQVDHDQVTILSDVAELASQIDVERARAAQERAEGALRAEDDAEVRAALARSHARLKAAGGAGVSGSPAAHH
jgi:F-type H+-transporting ATPase subunit epsilon